MSLSQYPSHPCVARAPPCTNLGRRGDAKVGHDGEGHGVWVDEQAVEHVLRAQVLQQSEEKCEHVRKKSVEIVRRDEGVVGPNRQKHTNRQTHSRARTQARST